MAGDDGDWKPTEASRARVQKRLREIDLQQVNQPKCWLCGQGAPKLDDFGLCSKVSVTHRQERDRIRAEMKSKAGVL